MIIGVMMSSCPAEIAAPVTRKVTKRHILGSSSSFFVAKKFKQGRILSFAMACSRRGAPVRDWRAAPTVDNMIPIETISEAQTQTIEGVYDLSTLTQSIAASIEVQGRTLASSEHLIRVEKQVQDSQARSEQQYNYVTSQANALADQIREIERQADQQQKSREQNDAHVARALVTLTQQNQQLMETNNNLMKKIERIIA